MAGAVLGRGVVFARVLGPLSVLRLGERERLRALGQCGVLRHAQLVRGWRGGGNEVLRFLRHGARNDGQHQCGRQFNAWTGNASRGYDRTFNTAAGGSGNVARGSNYNVYTGQRSTANAVSGTTAGGSTYNRAGATTAGPEGEAHAGGGSTYNARTGKTNTWNTGSLGNNHYADVNGNVYHNNGSSWQQHSSSGWGSASGDTSWADRESQARSTGDDRFGGFSNSFNHSFGGGG